MTPKGSVINKSLSKLQQDILEVLKRKGSLTRQGICKILGFKVVGFTVSKYGRYPCYEKSTTVYQNLVENKFSLLKRGLIEVIKQSDGQYKRKYYQLKNYKKPINIFKPLNLLIDMILSEGD